MALTNFNWSRKVALTIDKTKVPATQSNFPVALVWNGTTGNLPAEVYNNSETSPLTTGADIRFSSDSAGQTELPFEIVTFLPDPTVIYARVEIYVKLTSVSTSDNTVFYMWWKNPSATAYATNATYGRNAVWSNSFQAVWHMNEADTVDATGNGYTGEDHGTTPSSTILGTARSFNKTLDEYIEITGLCGSPGSSTIFAIGILTANAVYGSTFLSLGDHLGIYLEPASIKPIGFYSKSSSSWNATSSNSVFPLNTLASVCYCKNNSSTYSQKIYYNGGSVISTAGANAQTWNGLGSNTRIGHHGSSVTQGTSNWNGVLDEIRLSNVQRDVNWVGAEHNSIIGFETFLSAGTPGAANAFSSFNIFHGFK
jgi:hypothetical protein